LFVRIQSQICVFIGASHLTRTLLKSQSLFKQFICASHPALQACISTNRFCFSRTFSSSFFFHLFGIANLVLCVSVSVFIAFSSRNHLSYEAFFGGFQRTRTASSNDDVSNVVSFGFPGGTFRCTINLFSASVIMSFLQNSTGFPSFHFWIIATVSEQYDNNFSHIGTLSPPTTLRSVCLITRSSLLHVMRILEIYFVMILLSW